MKRHFGSIDPAGCSSVKRLTPPCANDKFNSNIQEKLKNFRNDITDTVIQHLEKNSSENHSRTLVSATHISDQGWKKVEDNIFFLFTKRNIKTSKDVIKQQISFYRKLQIASIEAYSNQDQIDPQPNPDSSNHNPQQTIDNIKKININPEKLIQPKKNHLKSTKKPFN